uniref:CSON000862 protein n=1 Tax=Culicoides sonorensis TaxID=179676 RepID=A0A336MI55_CULSO
MSAQLLKRSLQMVEENTGKDKVLKKKKEVNTSKAKVKYSESKKLEENLNKLMALSKPVMFLNARQGTRAKKLEQEERALKESEEKSVFTKEDFLRFERELFCDK